MIYISATLACIATLLKKAVSHSHMTFSWASCSQWNLRTFQTEQKLNFQEMPLSTLIQPPPLQTSTTQPWLQKERRWHQPHLLPNQANLLNLRTHYSNQPQRTLVLDNLSNQREICQDLLNGQNTLDYKDKRRSCLSD